MTRDRIYDYEPLWGNWRVDSLLGEGSFGSVYKVYREEMGHRYYAAVKIISIPTKEQYNEAEGTLGDDFNLLTNYFDDMVKNIVNEIKVLYSLSGNSNIINYQDHQVIKRPNELGWDILIRMEYVTSLRDYQKTRQLKRKEIIRLGIDICLALEVCSRKGIIHRDIKDENIFVNEDGVFKLGDFGISKELSGSSRAASMRGTPLYMAPEIYRGEKYDGRVDVYSLGMVLYKLLNHGRLPFMPTYPDNIKFKDSEAALEKRLSGDLMPLPDQADEILGEMIVKACAFNLEDRFLSASELKNELEKVLRDSSSYFREEIVSQIERSNRFPFADSESVQSTYDNQNSVETQKTEVKINTLDRTESALKTPKLSNSDKSDINIQTAENSNINAEPNMIQKRSEIWSHFKGKQGVYSISILVTLLVVIGYMFFNNFGLNNKHQANNQKFLVINKIGINDSETTIAGKSFVLTSRDDLVVDDANLFTDNQIAQLKTQVETLRSQYQMDLVIVTIEDNGGKSSRNFADDFYDHNGYGIGDERSGVLFLLDLDNREAYISTAGMGIRYLTDQRIEDVLDTIFEAGLSDGDYFSASEAFLSSTAEYLSQGIPPDQYTVEEG